MRFLLFSLLAAVLIVGSGCESSAGQENPDLPSQEVVSERDSDDARNREQVRDRREEERVEEEARRVEEEARRVEEEARRVEEEARRVEERLDDEFQDFEKAMEGLGDALAGLGEALRDEVAVEPVDFRRLRKVLPEGLRGFEVTSNEGETNGAVGIHVSHVKRTYESDDAQVSIAVVDLGSLRGLARLGLDGFDVNIDHEDDFGFERTTTFEGYPAHEKCDVEWDNTCEMQLFIGERFLVEVESEGLELEELHRMVGRIDLERLEDLKTYGVRKRD